MHYTTIKMEPLVYQGKIFTTLVEHFEECYSIFLIFTKRSLTLKDPNRDKISQNY